MTAWFAYNMINNSWRDYEERNKMYSGSGVHYEYLDYGPQVTGGAGFHLGLGETMTASQCLFADAAEEVSKILGSGHSEAVYESALEVELILRGFTNIRRQVPCPVEYKGSIVGTGYIDLLIEDMYVLELKTVAKLTSKDETQVKKYLKPYQRGFLINFNPSTGKVEVIRIGYQENTEQSGSTSRDSNGPLLQEPTDKEADSWGDLYIEGASQRRSQRLEPPKSCFPGTEG